MTATVEYSTVISNLQGEQLNEFPVKNIQYSYVLNAPGSLNFTVPLHHEKVTQDHIWPGNREVRLYRGGTLIWGGYIWTVDADSSAGTVRIGAEGWLSRFKRRYIDQNLTYTNTDVFAFAWDLIRLSQEKTDGNLGITRFSSALAGVTVNREYKASERRWVYDELEKLACQVGGIDFEIDPYKQWKTWYPHRGRLITNYAFELGKNIKSYYIPVDSSKQATVVTGIGRTTGDSTLMTVQTNAAAKAEYGLLEGTRSWKEVKDVSLLAARTQENVRVRGVPRSIVQIQVTGDDPELGAYEIGDHIPVRIKDGWSNFDKTLRIISITVALSNEGREAIGVYFDDGLGEDDE